MTYTIKPQRVGVNDFPVEVLLIDTNDTFSTVLAPGYLGNSSTNSGFFFTDKQFAIVYTTDAGIIGCTVVVQNNSINLVIPASDGNVFVDVPTTANYLGRFLDTTGVLTIAPGTAINPGPINSGVQNSIYGKFVAHTDNGTGSISLSLLNNSPVNGNMNIVGTALNTSNITYYLNDPETAAVAIATCTNQFNDVGANIVSFKLAVNASALASGGHVILYSGQHDGNPVYQVTELFISGNMGTNFSGGGGDRNLNIQSYKPGNATPIVVYSVIPAASLQTIVNGRWGDTNLPYPVSDGMSTPTPAGGDEIAVIYSGGTADYTTGQIYISGYLQRIS